MDIEQLKIFSLLAKLENMSQTAQYMNVSQPQISKAISALEQECNATFFDRAGRNIHLNEYGAAFLKYANLALKDIQNGELELQTLNKFTLGTVSLGTYAFAGIVTSCVVSYSKVNPQVCFNYLQKDADDSTHISNLDLILTPISSGRYYLSNYFPVWRKICHERYYVVFSRRFLNIPQSQTTLRLQDLKGLPFILMARPGIYNNYDLSILQEISNALGSSLQATYSVNAFITKLDLLSQGVGISLLPDSCLLCARQYIPDLTVCTLEGFDTTRTVILARKPREAMKPAALDFWNFALDYYKLPKDK